MDDTFGPEERVMIEHLLAQKFALSAEECAKLLADSEAQSARMTQLHPYTQAIFEQMPMEERTQLIEMLWEVAYADGILDPEEDSLIRRIAGLIYVTDRDRVLARKKVVDRLAAKRSSGAGANCAVVKAFAGKVFDMPLKMKRCALPPGATSAA